MSVSNLARVGALGATRHRASLSPAAQTAAASQARRSALHLAAWRRTWHGAGAVVARSITERGETMLTAG